MAHLFRVILPVDNIELAAGFYSQILNVPGIRVSPGRHYFNLGGTILACYDPVADGDEYGEGWKRHENQYIYISTPDLAKIFHAIKSSPATVLANIQQMPWGETLFYAIDPFGNPICFVDEKTVFTG